MVVIYHEYVHFIMYTTKTSTCFDLMKVESIASLSSCLLVAQHSSCHLWSTTTLQLIFLFGFEFLISLNLSRWNFNCSWPTGVWRGAGRGNRCSEVEFPPPSYGNRRDWLCCVFWIWHIFRVVFTLYVYKVCSLSLLTSSLLTSHLW